ncbi:SDR family oxidoreductase [Acaryochloris marina]|uniref:SDR family oxidoreductase n=1 Tax=Acaryochloris marina TaxID=155978 RepID=UPI001BB03B6B|nr:NAD(P)H-binding protein [Acaryochloris marina]QUY46040.1 NAD(P)H-binding protein [Acaryochloris marina S15]
MSKKRKKVLVAGATGYIGGGVLEVLHGQGFWVRALCRDKNRLRNTNWCDDIFMGHATQPDTLKGLCEDIDVVFSSIGIHSFNRHPTFWDVDYQANLNIFEAAKASGVKHFIFVSVLHASEMARLSPLAKARDQVAQTIMHSGMDYNIFAPTGFFNDAQEFLDAAKKKGVIRLFGDGSSIYNPLSALDFGEEVARVIKEPLLRNTVRPVGGCEKFSNQQMAELVFKILGQEPHIKSIPIWILTLWALALRPFNYNAYALVKFFEFTARTPDMTGEAIGHRHVEAFLRNLANGMSLVEADRALGSWNESRLPIDAKG